MEDNNRVGKNEEIDSFLKKNLRKPKNTEESMRIATDKLLQYLDKKYNKKGYLTKAKEAELAEMLGVSLKDKKNITYNESIKLRNALKNAGFSQGGVASTLNQAAKANGDDGLITLKRGEAVLTEEQTNAVQKLADLVPVERKITEEQERILMEHLGIPLDYSNMMPAYRNIPVNNTTNASVSVGDVNIHMDGSNVTDPDSFCNTLNHSLNMQGAIKRCVAADMAKSYSNTLGKF